MYLPLVSKKAGADEHFFFQKTTPESVAFRETSRTHLKNTEILMFHSQKKNPSLKQAEFAKKKFTGMTQFQRPRCRFFDKFN